VSEGALPSTGTMNRQQEDKIIKQAQDILERRMAVEKNIKVNLQNLMFYGAYYMGALDVARNITEKLLSNKPKGEDWIYLKAEWDLISASKRNMQLYLDGTEMRYRNHKRNKKGKLERCEAYFVDRISIIQELQ